MRIAGVAARKEPAENVIPMINVVFLLLVFFLITARITPPPPVEVAVPTAQGGPLETASDEMLIGPFGTPYYAGQVGDGVWTALADRHSDDPLTLRVDRAMAGSELARVLERVSRVTGSGVALVVED
ncbi:biopolymer transporter ExbD [Maritimibacter sp. DP1N21-5]|uniref:biopolymer transporter ExbD n=1 Tax=Maritimibacter sp. DP1N21-5 TaxID=2836867 RepID=UPI001C43D778|nr:biopolymer transporter ExbD [Maritimibacter sp. DP1N21-5]MBV7407695.1 biopolymer transporter ExbD [Maritimibacter sp. DP1N21-5]